MVSIMVEAVKERKTAILDKQFCVSFCGIQPFLDYHIDIN